MTTSLESAIDLADRVLSRFPDRLTPDNWEAFKAPLEDALRCTKVLRMLQGRVPKPKLSTVSSPSTAEEDLQAAKEPINELRLAAEEEAKEDYEAKKSQAKMVLIFLIGEDAFKYIEEEPVEEMWDSLVDRFTILSGGRGKTTKLRVRKLRQLIDLNPSTYAEGADLDAYVQQIADYVYQINFLWRQERAEEAITSIEHRMVPLSFDHDQTPISPTTLGEEAGFPFGLSEGRNDLPGDHQAGRGRGVEEPQDLISEELHRELLHAKLLIDHNLP